MKKIDLEKTILKGRLIFKNQFGKVFDIIFFSFLFTLWILFILSLLNIFNNFSKLGGLSLIIMMFFFSVFLDFIKWNRCTTVKKIYTGLSKKDNGLLIDRFIQRNNFDYKFYRKDYLQVQSKHVILWLKMELNFINKENEIY